MYKTLVYLYLTVIICENVYQVSSHPYNQYQQTAQLDNIPQKQENYDPQIYEEPDYADQNQGEFDDYFDEFETSGMGSGEAVNNLHPASEGVEIIPEIPEPSNVKPYESPDVKSESPEEKSIWRTLYQKLAEKWNYFGQKTKKAAKQLENKITTIYDRIRVAIPGVVDKFRQVLSGLGYTVQKGADYAVQKIALTFEEVEASNIIKELEERCIKGDKIVRDFFYLVGQKVEDWLKNKGQKAKNEEGSFLHQGQVDQNFNDQEYRNIMQNPDVCNQIVKMIDARILTKKEGDLLCQNEDENKIVPPVYKPEKYVQNQNIKIEQTNNPDKIDNYETPTEDIKESKTPILIEDPKQIKNEIEKIIEKQDGLTVESQVYDPTNDYVSKHEENVTPELQKEPVKIDDDPIIENPTLYYGKEQTGSTKIIPLETQRKKGQEIYFPEKQ